MVPLKYLYYLVQGGDEPIFTRCFQKKMQDQFKHTCYSIKISTIFFLPAVDSSTCMNACLHEQTAIWFTGRLMQAIALEGN
jgi:hypothetical protein